MEEHDRQCSEGIRHIEEGILCILIGFLMLSSLRNFNALPWVPLSINTPLIEETGLAVQLFATLKVGHFLFA